MSALNRADQADAGAAEASVLIAVVPCWVVMGERFSGLGWRQFWDRR